MATIPAPRRRKPAMLVDWAEWGVEGFQNCPPEDRLAVKERIEQEAGSGCTA
jgi:hypothetical protein